MAFNSVRWSNKNEFIATRGFPLVRSSLVRFPIVRIFKRYFHKNVIDPGWPSTLFDGQTRMNLLLQGVPH